MNQILNTPELRKAAREYGREVSEIAMSSLMNGIFSAVLHEPDFSRFRNGLKHIESIFHTWEAEAKKQMSRAHMESDPRFESTRSDIKFAMAAIKGVFSCCPVVFGNETDLESGDY